MAALFGGDDKSLRRNLNGDLITPEYVGGAFTKKQRILKILLDARLDNKPRMVIDGGPGNQVIRRGGYIAMHDLNHVCSARDVRLRELRRDHQIPIGPPHIFNDAVYIKSDGEEGICSTPHYRIELSPDEIRNMDWSRFWDIPFRGIYNLHQMEITKSEVIDFWICTCREFRISDAQLQESNYKRPCPKCGSAFADWLPITKQGKYHTEDNGQLSFMDVHRGGMG